MGIDPHGDIFLRSSVTGIEEEIVTVELKKGKRKKNHNPTRNRRVSTVKTLFDREFKRMLK